jgi:hypothetical protein
MMRLRKNELMLLKGSTKSHQEHMQVPFGIDRSINSATKQLYLEFACFLSFVRMKHDSI